MTSTSCNASHRGAHAASGQDRCGQGRRADRGRTHPARGAGPDRRREEPTAAGAKATTARAHPVCRATCRPRWRQAPGEGLLRDDQFIKPLRCAMARTDGDQAGDPCQGASSSWWRCSGMVARSCTSSGPKGQGLELKIARSPACPSHTDVAPCQVIFDFRFRPYKGCADAKRMHHRSEADSATSRCSRLLTDPPVNFVPSDDPNSRAKDSGWVHDRGAPAALPPGCGSMCGTLRRRGVELHT